MTLLYWFQAMPAWLALVMLCAYFVGIGVLLTCIGRRLTTRLWWPRNPTALGPAQNAIGTMTSILMGLVIVSLWADFRTARGTSPSPRSLASRRSSARCAPTSPPSGGARVRNCIKRASAAEAGVGGGRVGRESPYATVDQRLP